MTPKELKYCEEKIRERLEKDISIRLKPFFTDLRYGHPAYAQLHFQCPEEIFKGADDEAEMGVFPSFTAAPKGSEPACQSGGVLARRA